VFQACCAAAHDRSRSKVEAVTFRVKRDHVFPIASGKGQIVANSEAGVGRPFMAEAVSKLKITGF
jgi:hypothetical protein